MNQATERLSLLPLLLTAGFLLLAPLPLPYGYFSFLRLLVFGVSLWLAVLSLEINIRSGIFIAAIIAITFNPFFIISFDKIIWAYIDVLCAIVFAGFYFIYNKIFKLREDKADIENRAKLLKRDADLAAMKIAMDRWELQAKEEALELQKQKKLESEERMRAHKALQERVLVEKTPYFEYINKIRSQPILGSAYLETAIEDIDSGIIDASLVKEKWIRLNALVDKNIALTNDEISSGASLKKSLGLSRQLFPNLAFMGDPTIYCQYSGNSHGGTSEYFVYHDNEPLPLNLAVKDVSNISGIIETFFVFFELPKKGVFWHGLYDRDYDLLFTDSSLVTHLKENLKLSPNSIDLNFLIMPPSIRLVKDGDLVRASCLAIYRNFDIKDMSVLLAPGRVVQQPSRLVYGSGKMILY